MPSIGGRHVSQQLVDPTLLTPQEMSRQRQDGMRQLLEFLAT
jgi:hypothetical protein